MIISKNLQELRKISKVAKKSVEKKFGNKKLFMIIIIKFFLTLI